MVSIALLLAASTMGVMFGWQPMPDGSERYEYVVQIEPELAATLREGQAIPITSDIPDDVGPIGRIRIVVGRDELPRQHLTTRLKPQADQDSRNGIIETQYTVPPVEASGGRYGGYAANDNSAILPPDESGSGTSNALGKALQQSAEQARSLTDATKEQILPPNSNNLTPKDFFENNGQTVRSALDDTANRLQHGANQLVDRTGQQLRQTADQLAERTGYPFGQGNLNDNTQNGTSAEILPPKSATGPSTINNQSAGNRQRIDQPAGQFSPDNWRNSPQPPPVTAANTSAAYGNPGAGGQRDINTAVANPFTNGQQEKTPDTETSAGRYDNFAKQPPADTSWIDKRSARDPFDVVNRTANDSMSRLANSRIAQRDDMPSEARKNSDDDGLAFPRREATSTSQQNPTDDRQLTPPAVAEIRRDMLNRDLTEGTNVTATSLDSRRSQDVANTSTVGQDRESAWPPENSNPTQGANANSRGDMVFPMLLAWVLFTGSGLGNVFLLWSYRDMRNKYQGLIHGASSRRERYDD